MVVVLVQPLRDILVGLPVTVEVAPPALADPSAVPPEHVFSMLPLVLFITAVVPGERLPLTGPLYFHASPHSAPPVAVLQRTVADAVPTSSNAISAMAATAMRLGSLTFLIMPPSFRRKPDVYVTQEAGK